MKTNFMFILLWFLSSGLIVYPVSITCPGNQTRIPNPCASPTYTVIGTEFNPLSYTQGATITFNLSGATTGSGSSSLSGKVFNRGLTTVLWTATDGASNTITCSFSVTVNDTQAPTISCPGNRVVNVTGQCNAVVTYTAPVGTDNCPGATTIQTSGLPSGSIFPIGITTNTFIVIDASGNSTICSFIVNVRDIQSPSISCPADIVVSNDNNICGARYSYPYPLATDNCLGEYTTQTAGLPSGSIFPIGITTNTFKVTDASGGTSSCSFKVTVMDNQRPTILCPANITVGNDNNNCGAVVTYTAPVGTDNCPGAFTTQTAGLASGSIFPIGITTNTFKVTDASSLTATCSFTVTVNDTQLPLISCPENIMVGNDNNNCGAVVTYTAPVGTDNCPGASTTQTVGLASGSIFPIGITTNTFKVTDASGLTATCSFTVTVNDTQLPLISCPENIMVDNDNNNCGAVVTYTEPVGTDNCPGAVTIQTSGLPSGSIFPIGITTNSFQVTDISGNKSTCSFIVTVIDNQKPIIVVPCDKIVVTNFGNNNYTTIGTEFNTVILNDNCSSTPILSYTLSGATSGNGFNTIAGIQLNIGITTVCWAATDGSGNSVSSSFTVTVNQNVITGSFENNNNKQVNIYPNPATHTITITNSKLQNIDLCIYNLAGELLLKRELVNQKNEIDISFLSTGTFIINVSGMDWTVQKKIIKE
jgi:hypothetical protein